MARRYTSRKLHLFTLHAHDNGAALDDYRALFQSLSELSVEERSRESPTKLVALRRLILAGDLVRITAYEGPPGLAPLIFDLSRDEERIERLSDREVLATRTHAVIDLRRRDAVVEYNHRGAKAADIAAVLERAGRRHTPWRRLEVELAPVASADFAKAVNDFETIKVASLNIVRPNLNWESEKRHADALADESNGQRVEVAVFAGRNESLAKRRGLVRLIKTLGRQPKSALRNASVAGRRRGEQSDTTVSLERHLEHRNVRVELGPDGHPLTESIQGRLDEFLSSRRRRRHRSQ